MTANPPSGSELCTKCALCCDGSLFAKTHLHPDELESARALGMRIGADSKEVGFIQPCHLLNGTRCSIYRQSEYPQACSGFQCKLLERYLTEEEDLGSALATVKTARNLLATLQRLTPLGKDQRMTSSGIRLMSSYVLSLPKEQRILHARFLEVASRYAHLVTREFVEVEEPRDENAPASQAASSSDFSPAVG